ncbi:transmembrane protein, putative [Bodo saltans]|uniref:Transmembrane protein, putative n=1 Tax=Bodo saltans TaxID=75058 RepID=A0A0S4J2X4_BODSA|nr:transmembrane protein, putative [Bodo saltans]|eukprot:CUG50806.1 transmembrane protein, putative [Bodo saltans]
MPTIPFGSLVGLVLLLVTTHVAVGAWVNCPSQAYCEFELILKPQADWSGVVNTTLIDDLSSCTDYDEAYFHNVTKIFDTVVMGVVQVYTTDNASAVALSVVGQLNAGGARVQTFLSTYQVQSAVYGYSPVIVPSYLRVSDEPDQAIFAILGAVAAFLVVLQFGYGYWHFKGFGFITVENGERD